MEATAYEREQEVTTESYSTSVRHPAASWKDPAQALCGEPGPLPNGGQDRGEQTEKPRDRGITEPHRSPGPSQGQPCSGARTKHKSSGTSRTSSVWSEVRMVTLTFWPLESSTSSTTSSVGICCVSCREKGLAAGIGSPAPSATHSGSGGPPRIIPARQLLPTCWALRRKLLKVSLPPSVGSCRTGVEAEQGEELVGKARGPTSTSTCSAAPQCLQPDRAPCAHGWLWFPCGWGSQGVHLCWRREREGAGDRGAALAALCIAGRRSGNDASYYQSAARNTETECCKLSTAGGRGQRWARVAAGRQPGQCHRGTKPGKRPRAAAPRLPACMYFSSCSLRCSTSAGVSVKIFFGGKAGTTFVPYSFLSWEESGAL